jgi:hypothetical protein
VLPPTHRAALTFNVTAAPHRQSDVRRIVGKSGGRSRVSGPNPFPPGVADAVAVSGECLASEPL